MGTAIKLTEYMAAFSFDVVEELAMVLAVLLCGAELLIGLLLIYGLCRRAALGAASLFIFFFTLLTFYIVLRNPVKDCGCFGDALIISNEATFIKNLIFMAISLVLLSIDRGKVELRRRYGAKSIALVLAFGIPIYSVIWLPPMDFMPYNVGVDIAKEMGADSQQGEYITTLLYKNLDDGSIHEFSVEDTTWHDESLWEYIDTKSVMVSEGSEPSISSFDIIDSYGENGFDRLLGSGGDALALTIRSREISPSLGHKITGLCSAARQSGVELFALTIYPIEEIEDQLAAIGAGGVEVCNMDETLLKSIVRARDGYILFRGGVISVKRNFASATYIDSGAELENLDKNSALSIYLISIIAIFTVGIILAYKK